MKNPCKLFQNMVDWKQ